MKGTLFVLMLAFLTLNGFSQTITGQWNGVLKVQGIQLRIVFNINKNDSGYTSTMDSPDQGAKGIPVTTTTFINKTLKLEVVNAKIVYEGILGADTIVAGNFKQAGQSFAMNLSRKQIEKETVVRPQEPKKPYPYYSEDIKFPNKKDSITLAGTLTLPQKEGNFPVVILISGSGPQNRDEELLGHKPFLVLADYLTRKGIAVLRFDDRGTAESGGNFKTGTSLDFESDVESALKYLQTRKEINQKKIGLIGHSEGGMIAPMLAAKSKDVSFIVLLAGPGIPGDQLLLLQQQMIGKASGASEADLQKGAIINKGAFDMIVKSTNPATLKTDLTQYFKQVLKDNPDSARSKQISEDDYINRQINSMLSPWMQFFIKYDPAIALEKVKCPVLALDGEKDLQVAPEIDLKAIKEALVKGGNKNVTTKELPNLNHLFQECTTGSPDEYAKIEQTFSPTALVEISNWILKQVQ